MRKYFTLLIAVFVSGCASVKITNIYYHKLSEDGAIKALEKNKDIIKDTDLIYYSRNSNGIYFTMPLLFIDQRTNISHIERTSGDQELNKYISCYKARKCNADDFYYCKSEFLLPSSFKEDFGMHVLRTLRRHARPVLAVSSGDSGIGKSFIVVTYYASCNTIKSDFLKLFLR